MEDIRRARKKKRIKKSDEGKVEVKARKKSPLLKTAALAGVLAGLVFLFLFNAYERPVLYYHTCQKDYGSKTGMSLAYRNVISPYYKYGVSLEKKKPKSLFHGQIVSIVKNAPMKDMIDEIAEKEQPVAAFLVGIAMKESKFGTYTPKKEGRECYNYWGYRGKENTTASGYSCFDNPSHAVQVVGDRIASLVKSGIKTPNQMIVWKCGHTCAGHSKESVDKWIADVSINYYKLYPGVQVAKK